MDALQRAVPIPQHEVGMRGALWRQILWQRLPLAARREHIKDRVQNLANVHPAPTPAAFGRRYRRFDQRPFAVAQITRVAQAMAVGSTAVFRLPHSAPLSRDAGAGEGITTDSSDSTTLWIGSKNIRRSHAPPCGGASCHVASSSEAAKLGPLVASLKNLTPVCETDQPEAITARGL